MSTVTPFSVRSVPGYKPRDTSPALVQMHPVHFIGGYMLVIASGFMAGFLCGWIIWS